MTKCNGVYEAKLTQNVMVLWCVVCEADILTRFVYLPNSLACKPNYSVRVVIEQVSKCTACIIKTQLFEQITA